MTRIQDIIHKAADRVPAPQRASYLHMMARWLLEQGATARARGNDALYLECHRGAGTAVLLATRYA